MGGQGAGGQPTSCAPGVITPGPAPLRRLTRFEYTLTTRKLLNDSTLSPTTDFPLEEQSGGFDNDANFLKVPLLLAEAYVAASQSLANTVVAGLATRLPCAATATAGGTAAEDQCAAQLVDTFATDAYRRPLSTEERNRLLATFHAGREFLDFTSSLGAVIESVLLSPQFLYRIESGTPVDGAPNVLKLDPFSMASRLSYFFWGSMPDAELMQAAAEGQLETAADVRAQAERLLDAADSRNVLRHFNDAWMELGGVDGQQKSAPDYTADIGPLLRQQTETFLEHQYLDGGTLATVLTAPYTYMNAPLAKFFGVTGGPAGDAFEKVDLDPTRHAGVLTEASFLSWNATSDRTHPILRGVFVRRKLLCDPPGAPPPNVVDSRGTVTDPNATERERLAVHRADPSCAGCHSLIDPIGLAFENFDATGRWRDLEAGMPVNVSGGLPDTDVEGDVNGAVELVTKLAESQQVKDCLADNWFRYAYGRGGSTEDACSIERVHQAFTESGGNLRDLLLTLTQTDAFLYRPASEVAP